MFNSKINWEDFKNNLEQTIKNNDGKNFEYELDKINFDSITDVRRSLKNIYNVYKDIDVKKLQVSNSFLRKLEKNVKIIISSNLNAEIKKFFGLILAKECVAHFNYYESISHMKALGLDYDVIYNNIKMFRNLTSDLFYLNDHNIQNYIDNMTLFFKDLNHKKIGFEINTVLTDLFNKKSITSYIYVDELIDEIKKNKDFNQKDLDILVLKIAEISKKNYKILKDLNYLENITEKDLTDKAIPFPVILKVDKLIDKYTEFNEKQVNDVLEQKYEDIKKLNVINIVDIKGLTVKDVSSLIENFNKKNNSKINQIFKNLKFSGKEESLLVNRLKMDLKSLRTLLAMKEDILHLKEVEDRKINLIENLASNDNFAKFLLKEVEEPKILNKFIDVLIQKNKNILIDILDNKSIWNYSEIEKIFVSRKNEKLNKNVLEVFIDSENSLDDKDKSEVLFDMLVEKNKVFNHTKNIIDLIDINKKIINNKNLNKLKEMNDKKNHLLQELNEKITLKDIEDYVKIIDTIGRLKLDNETKKYLAIVKDNALFFLYDLKNSIDNVIFNNLLDNISNLKNAELYIPYNYKECMNYNKEIRDENVNKFILENILNFTFLSNKNLIKGLIESLKEDFNEKEILLNILNSKNFLIYNEKYILSESMNLSYKKLLTEDIITDSDVMLEITLKMNNNKKFQETIMDLLPYNIKSLFLELSNQNIPIHSFLKEYVLNESIKNKTLSNKVSKKI